MKKVLLIFCMLSAIGMSACVNNQQEQPASSAKETETTTPQEVIGTTTEQPTSEVVTEPTTTGEEEVKENLASEVLDIVINICENREFPFYAENSLGKDLQNEVISMKERAELLEFYHEFDNVKIYDYYVSGIRGNLFAKAIWYEVTESAEQAAIEDAMDLGFIRIYNDNREEFIVLKSINAAIYKNAESTRYFTWFNKWGRPGDATDFCNFWYDGIAAGTKKLSYMVIEADPSKSREELAYEMMEAYRQCASTLLPDNDHHFDELIIISLESYDESDSNPDNLIGIITEDLLRFDVTYAVNSANEGGMLCGSWYYADEGEYEGYMINGCMVDAQLINGKWYCTGMWNG